MGLQLIYLCKETKKKNTTSGEGGQRKEYYCSVSARNRESEGRVWGGCDCKRGSRKNIIHNLLIGVNVWRAVFKSIIYKAIVIVGVLPSKMMLINT